MQCNNLTLTHPAFPKPARLPTLRRREVGDTERSARLRQLWLGWQSCRATPASLSPFRLRACPAAVPIVNSITLNPIWGGAPVTWPCAPPWEGKPRSPLLPGTGSRFSLLYKPPWEGRPPGLPLPGTGSAASACLASLPGKASLLPGKGKAFWACLGSLSGKVARAARYWAAPMAVHMPALQAFPRRGGCSLAEGRLLSLPCKPPWEGLQCPAQGRFLLATGQPRRDLALQPSMANGSVQ